jgi:hypothetical protein
LLVKVNESCSLEPRRTVVVMLPVKKENQEREASKKNKKG